MSCDELNATLAWLYGEGEDAHAVHIASCEVCMEVVAEHEQVLSAVTRSRPVYASPDTARTPRKAANVGTWVVAIAAVCMAAVLLGNEASTASSAPAEDVRVALDVDPGSWDVALDADLEELAWDIQVLSDDGSIL